MDLGGLWRAVPADDELRRVLPEADLDDRDWARVAVPGHWHSEPALDSVDGPVFYRHPFTADRLDADRRAWLTFEGLFYQADIWLDGSYLGDTEGYFAPQTFEVSDHLRQRDDHLVAVELSCSPQTDLRHKRNLTGVFQHWDAIDPAFNPGGIWAPVTLTTTGPVRLASLRILCREATTERATLDIRAVLDADTARSVTVTTAVRRADGAPGAPTVAGASEDHNLAAGPNRVRWRVTVDRPALWWPHALGGRTLHDVTVDVAVGGESSDSRIVTTGLRQVRVRNFIARVNGERLFLKGANLGPGRRSLAEVTPDDVRRDLQLARGAGLDLLRVHAHIGAPALYDEADRTGMLLWQDLPLQWGYGPVRREAVRQARQAVDLLGHHPSLAMWCGHDEPAVPGPTPGDDTMARPRPRSWRDGLPGWSHTGLDRSVRRALERADPSRPVIAHAGVPPHPSGGTDTHLSLGWDQGDERDLPRLIARWPVLARFIGSFGPAAVPGTDSFMAPEAWPDLDWDHLHGAHGMDVATFARRIAPADHGDFAGWRDATQAYQARVVRHHVETLRRLKYRPTGGFCHALLADAQPAVSRALLDDRRVPKAGYAALAAACAPVIVVADRPAASYPPGSRVDLDVHVVSDLRRPMSGVRATAVLSWPGGSRRWGWSGQVPADACVRIGHLRTALPDGTPPGPLGLDLTLRWDDDDRPDGVASVTNRYESAVSSGPIRRSGRTLPVTDAKRDA
jgi:beta-mannosidase